MPEVQLVSREKFARTAQCINLRCINSVKLFPVCAVGHEGIGVYLTLPFEVVELFGITRDRLGGDLTADSFRKLVSQRAHLGSVELEDGEIIVPLNVGKDTRAELVAAAGIVVPLWAVRV